MKPQYHSRKEPRRDAAERGAEPKREASAVGTSKSATAGDPHSSAQKNPGTAFPSPRQSCLKKPGGHSQLLALPVRRKPCLPVAPHWKGAMYRWPLVKYTAPLPDRDCLRLRGLGRRAASRHTAHMLPPVSKRVTFAVPEATWCCVPVPELPVPARERPAMSLKLSSPSPARTLQTAARAQTQTPKQPHAPSSMVKQVASGRTKHARCTPIPSPPPPPTVLHHSSPPAGARAAPCHRPPQACRPPALQRLLDKNTKEEGELGYSPSRSVRTLQLCSPSSESPSPSSSSSGSPPSDGAPTSFRRSLGHKRRRPIPGYRTRRYLDNLEWYRTLRREKKLREARRLLQQLCSQESKPPTGARSSNAGSLPGTPQQKLSIAVQTAYPSSMSSSCPVPLPCGLPIRDGTGIVRKGILLDTSTGGKRKRVRPQSAGPAQSRSAKAARRSWSRRLVSSSEDSLSDGSPTTEHASIHADPAAPKSPLSKSAKTRTSPTDPTADAQNTQTRKKSPSAKNQNPTVSKRTQGARSPPTTANTRDTKKLQVTKHSPNTKTSSGTKITPATKNISITKTASELSPVSMNSPVTKNMSVAKNTLTARFTPDIKNTPTTKNTTVTTNSVSSEISTVTKNITVTKASSASKMSLVTKNIIATKNSPASKMSPDTKNTTATEKSPASKISTDTKNSTATKISPASKMSPVTKNTTASKNSKASNISPETMNTRVIKTSPASKISPVTTNVTATKTSTASKISPVTTNVTATKTSPTIRISLVTKNTTVIKNSPASKMSPVTKNFTATKTSPDSKISPVTKNVTATKTSPDSKISPVTKNVTATKTSPDSKIYPVTKNVTATKTSPDSKISPVTKNTTVTKTSPTIKISLVTKNTTAIKNSPASKSSPGTKNTTTTKSSPASKSSPGTKNTTTTKSSPASKSSPGTKNTTTTKSSPASKISPGTKNTTVIKNSLASKISPVPKNTTATKTSPTIKISLVTTNTAVTTNFTVSKISPASKSSPATKNTTVNKKYPDSKISSDTKNTTVTTDFIASKPYPITMNTTAIKTSPASKIFPDTKNTKSTKNSLDTKNASQTKNYTDLKNTSLSRNSPANKLSPTTMVFPFTKVSLTTKNIQVTRNAPTNVNSPAIKDFPTITNSPAIKNSPATEKLPAVKNLQATGNSPFGSPLSQSNIPETKSTPQSETPCFLPSSCSPTLILRWSDLHSSLYKTLDTLHTRDALNRCSNSLCKRNSPIRKSVPDKKLRAAAARTLHLNKGVVTESSAVNKNLSRRIRPHPVPGSLIDTNVSEMSGTVASEGIGSVSMKINETSAATNRYITASQASLVNRSEGINTQASKNSPAKTASLTAISAVSLTGTNIPVPNTLLSIHPPLFSPGALSVSSSPDTPVQQSPLVSTDVSASKTSLAGKNTAAGSITVTRRKALRNKPVCDNNSPCLPGLPGDSPVMHKAAAGKALVTANLNGNVAQRKSTPNKDTANRSTLDIEVTVKAVECEHSPFKMSPRQQDQSGQLCPGPLGFSQTGTADSSDSAGAPSICENPRKHTLSPDVETPAPLGSGQPGSPELLHAVLHAMAGVVGTRKAFCQTACEGLHSGTDRQHNVASLLHHPSTPGCPQTQGVAGGTPAQEKAVVASHYFNNLQFLLKEKAKGSLPKPQVLEEERKLQRLILELQEVTQEQEREGSQGDHDFTGVSTEFFSPCRKTESTLPPLPPGESVFTPLPTRSIFSQLPLLLHPQTPRDQQSGALEKLFFSSSPAQQLQMAQSGLLRQLCRTVPCSPALARWLFKAMACHSDPLSSLLLCRELCALTLHAGETHKCAWCPGLDDIADVFIRLGARRCALFPEEGDDQQSLCSRSPSQPFSLNSGSQGTHKDGAQGDGPYRLPEVNLTNVFKFLAVCGVVNPGWLENRGLMQLVVLVMRVGLDRGFCGHAHLELKHLLLVLLHNLGDWRTQLPELCLTLADLSKHHHTLLWLVQLLPDCRERWSPEDPRCTPHPHPTLQSCCDIYPGVNPAVLSLTGCPECLW
ncbi:uncharacterized protein [Lepisosteus oculatus]|uniref:uncharacterized protein isoform X2 n=1 Tax=Lepisosteus oculatus TaxID=7918 RepID=UPI0035F4FEE6